MRLRRRIFRPTVRMTEEQSRPITVVLAGLEFDCSVHDARRLADDLDTAITEIEERQAR